MLQLLLLLGGFLAFFVLWKKFGGKKLNFGQMVKLFGLGALVVLGVWLILTGKIAGVFAVAMGLWPWIQRGLTAHGWWRRWKAMNGGAQTTGSGKTSEANSHFLAMRLDHDSGHMEGRILVGQFSGRMLSSLTLAEAAQLRGEIAQDHDSLQLFESWLERAHPDWLGMDAQSQAAANNTAEMDAEQAYAILGLSANATESDIRSAHRRLMQANHPDRGGSVWLASRINLARDFLLALVSSNKT